MNVSYESLMQLIQANRNKEQQISPLKTIPLKSCSKDIQSQFQTQDKDLRNLFLNLFTHNNPQTIELKSILPFQQKKTAMPVCNKLLKNSQYVYRCYDCTTHQSAVLCVQCFENGNHHGHRFTKINSGGGNCDCGNPDAIDVKGFCKYHNGKGQEMIINESEQLYFNKCTRQLFIWILKLYNHPQSQTIGEHLLIHFIIFLDWLNTQSLYYNTLTNRLLFNNKNQMINHIFLQGTKTKTTNLAKKSTQLFLKMFSLEVFKQNLTQSYLIAFNQIQKFESTKFQSLFIQLFANNDLVERVVQRKRISLDPRGRNYSVDTYYQSLSFMSSIKPSAARTFFIPLIENGGVDFRLLDEIEKECEKGSHSIEEFFQSDINIENMYYNISKIIIQLIKDDKPLLQLQIRNKYTKILSYSFLKNNNFLTYQRIFIISIYTYFQFDHKNISIHQILKLLNITLKDFKKFISKICQQFIICLNQFAKTLACINFGWYAFQGYNNLYCRSSNGNMVILMDMLGLKFCGKIFQELNQRQEFQAIFIRIIRRQNRIQKFNKFLNDQPSIQPEQYIEDPLIRQQVMQTQPQTPFQTKPLILFIRQYTSLISLLLQTIITDRPQITLTSQLEIKTPYLTELYQQQFKKLLLNKKQLTVQQFQEMNKFWFKTPNNIDKGLISTYLNYDKNKKKYVVRQQIKGVEIKKQYLISLLKCPDNYIKKNQGNNLEVEITENVSFFRNLVLPQGLVFKVFRVVLEYVKILPVDEVIRELKSVVHCLKLIENVIVQEQNTDILQLFQLIQKIFNKNAEIMKEIKPLLSKNKQGYSQSQKNINNQKNQEQQLKRKQLLRKKKQQKLKKIKNNYTHQKSKTQHLTEPTKSKQQLQNQQICIYCHETNKEKPLFYLGSLFSSNIVYSILQIQGINPYFQSCFHSVHNECFIQCCKNKQKILCPLCKSVSNLLLINQKQIKNAASFDIYKQKLEIAFAHQYKHQFQNILIQITKSLIQFYFHRIINQQPSNKEIKIYVTIIEVIKEEYRKMDLSKKEEFLKEIQDVGKRYEKGMEDEGSYNFGVFVEVVMAFLVFFIKEEKVDFQIICKVLSRSDKISYKDLDNIYHITKELYSLPFQQPLPLNRSISLPQHQLKTYYKIFTPPKTITDLLLQKKTIQNQQICKLGHNICICLICLWKGCLDCKQCYQHTLKFHNRDCIFFNYLTGGLHHYYINFKVDIRSLYRNELGEEWLPKYGKEEYYLQVDLYSKLMDGLKNGNLAKTVRNNYQSLRSETMVD